MTERKQANLAQGQATSDYKRRRRKPKKLLNYVFSQKTTIILVLLLQFVVLFMTFRRLSDHYTYVQVIFTTMASVLAIYILNTDQNAAYKLVWLIPLLVLPIFTTVIYIILANQPQKRRVRNLYAKKTANTRAFLTTDKELMEEMKASDPELYRLARYIDDFAQYPAYRGAKTEYYSSGEKKFARMKERLREAKEFIFLEYFIIDDGEMWGEILDILVERCRAGVEIRVLCDGMGSQFTIPGKDIKTMRAEGIKFQIFNRFTPLISTIQNNRDHRKILVIDGICAFTGGINLADEYINRRIRFGHWKDTAVMVEGDCVWSFTMMFLQMWEVISGETAEYNQYKVKFTGETRGIVIPYGDSPLDEEEVGKLVYLDILNTAKDHVYITTPYFIPDDEILTALELAAKSGVDVRIITPHIPDKWLINCITRSYYRDLLRIGVKVYEYSPGFIHAKNFLADDKKAVVGTINLDYRSLYLHFECAAFMQDVDCIKSIRRDFDDMFEHNCRMITAEDVRNIGFWSRFASVILRIFAPLL